MQEQNKPKKNHWTQSKVDNANKKINKEIYVSAQRKGVLKPQAKSYIIRI